MSTFELILKINGFPIDKAKQKLVELKEESHTNRIKNQQEEKWKIFNEHFYNNPFYNQKCRNTFPKDWNEVPVIKKKDLQQPLQQMINPTIKKNKLLISKTSGSTGTPMAFAKDKFCHAMSWAQILHNFSCHGIAGDDMQARFYGIPVDGISYYKERFKDLLSNRVRFVVNDLSENVLVNYVKTFSREKVKYIYGYTNSIKVFADYLLQKDIKLKEICPSLKCCIVTSEVCTPSDKKVLDNAFQVPVLNEYGASEIGVIAFHDQNYNWKCSDEDLFVEILDENGIPVKEGAEGRIVVTSLYNKAMPFIRYEIGDLGALRITDQGTYLNKLQGRLTDTLRLPSGRVMPGATLYIASKIIYESLPGLKEFIITQSSLNTIEYDLVVDGPVCNKIKEDIIALTWKYLEPGLEVKINKVDNIKRTASGKFKFFQSYIDSPDIIKSVSL